MSHLVSLENGHTCILLPSLPYKAHLAHGPGLLPKDRSEAHPTWGPSWWVHPFSIFRHTASQILSKGDSYSRLRGNLKEALFQLKSQIVFPGPGLQLLITNYLDSYLTLACVSVGMGVRRLGVFNDPLCKMQTF